MWPDTWAKIRQWIKLKRYFLPVRTASTSIKLANVGQLTRVISTCFAVQSYNENADGFDCDGSKFWSAVHTINSVLTWWKELAAVQIRKRYTYGGKGKGHGKKLCRRRSERHYRQYHSDSNGSSSNQVCAYALLATASGLFSWDENRISDEELIKLDDSLKSEWETFDAEEDEDDSDDGWKIVVNQKDFKIWKRIMPGTNLYKYKVMGRYTDISPNQFYRTQCDLNYRKKWDVHVSKLEVRDRDPEGTSEVIHWESKFPFPLSNRDYVYIRRGMVDKMSKTIAVLSRSISHPDIKESSDTVRVSAYNSVMLIKPHNDFDEPGLDYLLIYFDNPDGYIPSYCINWATSSAVQGFIKQLHSVTIEHTLHDQPTPVGA